MESVEHSRHQLENAILIQSESPHLTGSSIEPKKESNEDVPAHTIEDNDSIPSDYAPNEALIEQSEADSSTESSEDEEDFERQLLIEARKRRTKTVLGDKIEAPASESSLPPSALDPQPIMATVSRYNTTLDLERKPTYTVYEIVVVHEALRWSVWKRYSEFAQLHAELSKHPDCTDIKLPKLPPRKLFGNMDEKFVEKRCAMLMVYWDELMHHVSVLSSVAPFLQFIGVLSTPNSDPSSREALPHLQERYIRIDSLMLLAQEGDIILFQCGGVLPSLQRGLFRSHYDHIGVIVRIPEQSTDPSSLCIMEATIDGVYSYQLHRRLCAWFSTGAHMAYRQLKVNRTREIKRALAEFVDETDGKPYKLSAGKLLFGGNDTNAENIGEDAYFCSELVASIWKVMGALPLEKSASKYLPADFADAANIKLTEGVELLPEILIQFKTPAVLFAEELPTPTPVRKITFCGSAVKGSERNENPGESKSDASSSTSQDSSLESVGRTNSHLPMGYPKALRPQAPSGNDANCFIPSSGSSVKTAKRASIFTTRRCVSKPPEIDASNKTDINSATTEVCPESRIGNSEVDPGAYSPSFQSKTIFARASSEQSNSDHNLHLLERKSSLESEQSSKSRPRFQSDPDSLVDQHNKGSDPEMIEQKMQEEEYCNAISNAVAKQQPFAEIGSIASSESEDVDQREFNDDEIVPSQSPKDEAVAQTNTNEQHEDSSVSVQREVRKAERDFTEYTLHGLNHLLSDAVLRKRALERRQ